MTRHNNCHYSKQHTAKISTTILTSCRQIYNEARHIPYTTNTFSFGGPNSLTEFITYLENSGFGHHLNTRSVRLDVCERVLDTERSWARAIKHHLSLRLPKVHQISIYLHRWYPKNIAGCRTPAEFEARQFSRDCLMSALLELRKLAPLRATCTFGSFKRYVSREAGSGLPQHSGTHAEKKVWARYITNAILRKNNQFASSSSLAVEEGREDAHTELKD